MTPSSISKARRKGKSPKFYMMGPNPRLSGTPCWHFANMDALLMGRVVLTPPIGRQGFDEFPEAPLLVIDGSSGRVPHDLEQCYGYWLVSDAMKRTLEALDPEAVAFVKCEVRLQDGSRGPQYWLCDVMRVLDVVDEERSDVTIKFDPNSGRKFYSLLGGAKLAFDPVTLGSSRIWRIVHMEDRIFCDEGVKAACVDADLSGIAFRDASKL